MDFLYREYNWKPVMLVDNGRDWLEKEGHADVLKIDSIGLRQAQIDYTRLGDPVPLDEGIIHSLSKFELDFLGNNEDSTGWNFSFFERKSFYFDILKFWNTVIQNLKPDLIVFFTWPHTASCHSLYLLSKHYYNIDLLFVDPVPLLNQYYHLVGNSITELYNPFIDLYRSNKPVSLGSETKQYFEGIVQQGGKTPDYINKVYEKNRKDSFKRVTEFLRLVAATVVNGKGFKKGLTEWKKNEKPYYNLNSRMNLLEHFWFVERLRRRNRKLLKKYRPFCSAPDKNPNYVYFAASYQPEATTAINGSIFEDHFLVLDILSTIIPEGWLVYYKEHPAIFEDSTWARGALKRDKEYYLRVKSYPNVKLIMPDVSSFELMDHARAVATVTGTVGWEAAVRGIPVLSFGYVWYMACKSIFHVRTLDDAKVAINKIQKGFKPDQKDIERYAAAIEQVAVKGLIHREFAKNIQKCPDPEFEMERIGHALYDAYERFYTTPIQKFEL